MAEDNILIAVNQSFSYAPEVSITTNKTNYEPIVPTKACLVAETGRDRELAHILTDYFGLQVVYSEDGQDYAMFNDVLFVISNFESHFMRILKTQMCISPLLIWNAFHAKKKLPTVRPNRPIYCSFMQGMCFFVEGFIKNESQKLVDYIHFMGGSVYQKFQVERILIAKSARQPNYRVAVNLGKKVFTLEYIEYCWKKRDDSRFNPNEPEILNKYQLRCFYGLSLFFHGFSKEDMAEFAKEIEKNSGKLVQQVGHATHVIIHDDSIENTCREDFERCGALPDACYVTIQWFWKSVHLDFCGSEKLYLAYGLGKPSREKRGKCRDSPVIMSQKGRKSRSKSSLDCSITSNIDNNCSSENLDPKQVKNIDKRYQVCEELIQTETNYISYLQLINNLFKEPLKELIKPDKPGILTKQQIFVIFGRITPIINIHTTILNSLKNLMTGQYINYGNIGLAWSRQMPELKKVYPPFINSYDDARKTLEYCLETVPKFHSFVKVAESDPVCYKITLKDMLIKPVQRLPSVVLLLNELIKRTDKNSKDMPYLKQAVEVLQGVLDSTNESCRKTEAYQKFLEVVSQFDGLHPTLICSNRQFIDKIEMIVLNDNFFNLPKGTQIAFFLFHDCVMLTKNRLPGFSNTYTSSNQNLSQSFFNSTTRGTLSRNMGTLSRNISFLRKERKQYKMIELVKFFSFKVIRYGSRNEIILLKIRDDEEGDFLFIGQAAEPYTFHDALDFMKVIRTKIREHCSKEIRIEELTDDMINGMQRDDSDDFYVIQKAISNIHSGAPIRRRSTLRRAVSNVSLGISNGLQKFSSRVHLSFINESGL